MNRREFLKVSAAVLTVAAGIKAFHIPEAITEEQIPYPQKGWLETSLPGRPAFLTLPNEGHRDYLVYMTQNHPALRAMMKESYNELLYGPVPQRRPLLGEYFAGHVERAKKVLKANYHNPSDENDRPTLENAVHCAFYTMAATLHADIMNSSFDLRNGYGIELPEDIFQYRKLFTDAFRFKVPLLYPAVAGEDESRWNIYVRFLGHDRSVHFAQHAFISHMYQYSRLDGLQDADRMHDGLKVARLPREISKETLLLSEIIGQAWEGKETLSSLVQELKENDDNSLLELFTGFFERDDIPSGYFDELVQLDLAANDLGSRFAVGMSEEPFTQTAYDDLISKLNNSNQSIPVAEIENPIFISLSKNE